MGAVANAANRFDASDLERFVAAQDPVYETVLAELRGGRKRTHWMWFVFPQLRGLGFSSLAQYYGIASLDEARRYLAHPVLGPRLETCSALVAASTAGSLHEIFGDPDDLKFCSSMTLFAFAADNEQSIYARALSRWCRGSPDERTLAMLG